MSKLNVHNCFFLITLFIFCAVHTTAQEEGRIFYAINTDKGLSHHKVNTIIQDSRGFMWIGTEDGLNRYDGKNFTYFRNDLGNKGSLSGNIITGILEDEQQLLWVSTADGGLSSYDYKKPALRQFKQYKYEESNPYSLPENRINFLIDDNKGNLWIATGRSHILRFNKKTERFDYRFFAGEHGIASMHIDQKGMLRLSRIGGGTLVIHTVTLKSSVLPDQDITAVLSAEDKAGHVWVAGELNSGLRVIDKKTKKIIAYKHHPHKPGSLVNNHVNSIYTDHSGRVWVGTNNGISVYNPLYQSFEKTYLPVKNGDHEVYDFYHDENGSLWVGTSGGLFIRDLKTGDFQHRKLSYKGVPVAVTKFYRDLDGTLYLGTNYTLFIYDGKKNRLSTLPNTDADPLMKRITGSKIVSIVRDTIGTHPVLIVSPYGHYITYYDFIDKRWISKEDTTKKIVSAFNLKDNMIRKLHKTGDGNIWVATAKYGLGHWNPNHSAAIRFHASSTPNSLSLNNDDVFDVLEAENNSLWVSTYGAGLKYYNGLSRQVTPIRGSSKLSEGIQTDLSGNLWIVCNGHIHKYDSGTATYGCYKPAGLMMDAGLSGYIYKDNNGNLYIGGMNYFVAFNPNRVPKIKRSPNVYFTDFKIFDTSFNELLSQKNIELQNDQNYFSVEFAAPEYNGDNIQYTYMLEGMDKKWISAGKRNFAVYVNLPAGTYNFKVKAGNWQAEFADNINTIKITVLAPFWLRSWFLFLSGLMIIGFAILVYRYRIKELMNRYEVRNRIALDLHDHIGSTLSSISVYSQVAKIYQQQQNNYQLDKVLNNIGETATEMIGEMGDIVWAINPKNDHLSSIYSRMESYARPLCKAKDISFELHTDAKVPLLKLEMNVKKNLYLIFKEAINNAVKYASCQSIEVKLYYKDGLLKISIYDNGIGFDQIAIGEQDGLSLSGNGIRNIKMRAKEINAELGIFSAKNGMGTLIEVLYKIP